MKFSYGWRISALIALILALSSVEALAASHLATCSLNGIVLQSDIEVGYAGIGSTLAADYDSGSAFDQVVIPTVSGTAAAMATKIPATGAAKDVVDGTMKTEFFFGSPFTSFAIDTFMFEIDAVGSALNSTNTAGNASDAVATATGVADFYVDIVPPNDCDGYIQLSALRNLRPFETFLEINVIMDPNSGTPTLLATLSPGDPATSIFVAEDHLYRVQLDYQLQVPFGVDPPFDLAYQVGVSPSPVVPSPQVPALIAVSMGLSGFVALSALRRCRSKRA